MGNHAVARLLRSLQGGAAGLPLARTAQAQLLRDMAPNPQSTPVPLRPVASDTNLVFTFEREDGKPKQVTYETLASWVARRLDKGDDQRQLVQQLLNSHDFTGSEAAKRHWATVVEKQFADLQSITSAKQNAAKRERENDRAREQFKEFMSHPYSGHFSHGMGYFYAVYEPAKQTLTATVPVYFTFVGWRGSPSWRKQFVSQMASFWSRHELICTRPGWESAKARVKVKVDDLDVTPAGSHARHIEVHIDRPGQYVVSKVTKGAATLEASDLERKPGGGSIAAHEFGHMLGLDDEYYDKNEPNERWAGHSDLVKAEFGYGVPRLEERTDTDPFKHSIMFDTSKGRVLAEHGVVFLAAIAKITGVPDWDVRLQF